MAKWLRPVPELPPGLRRFDPDDWPGHDPLGQWAAAWRRWLAEDTNRKPLPERSAEANVGWLAADSNRRTPFGDGGPIDLLVYQVELHHAMHAGEIPGGDRCGCTDRMRSAGRGWAVDGPRPGSDRPPLRPV